VIFMTVKSIKNGNSITLSVKGRVDTTTAPELEQAVKNCEGISELIIDMNELEYISSAGLRVILYANKMMNGNGSMKLINVSAPIMEILDITGFTDIITIE